MAIDPARTAAGRLAPEAAGAYLGELFDQHGRMVYGVCRLMLRDRTEAEDAAQQTFLSAYRTLLNGQGPRDPVAWLATIARNECRARIRARMAEPLALVGEAYPSTADLESVTSRRAEIAALCEALAELPAQQRDAVVLREFYGLSYEEVSAVVGVSVSAVDGLLVRARRRLQAELRPTRLASGALVVPLALQTSLASAVPGFAASASASGLVAKLASLPIAAKLAGAAATVAVVTTVGAMGPPAPPGTLTGGGASSVHVASTDFADVGSRGPNKTTAAGAFGEHDADDAATARQEDRDEDQTEEDDRESGDDSDDEADELDEADDPDQAEGVDEPDEPDDDSSSSSSSGPSLGSGSGSGSDFDEPEIDD